MCLIITRDYWKTARQVEIASCGIKFRVEVKWRAVFVDGIHTTLSPYLSTHWVASPTWCKFTMHRAVPAHWSLTVIYSWTLVLFPVSRNAKTKIMDCRDHFTIVTVPWWNNLIILLFHWATTVPSSFTLYPVFSIPQDQLGTSWAIRQADECTRHY